MPDRGAKSMLEQRPLLLLIDGPALVHRGWHAIREPLNVSRTGEEVRAVYGFMNTFLRYLNDWNPTHCAIAFDPKGPTFRHDQYTEYKAHRPSMPPELRPQFGHVRRLMELFNVPIFEVPSYEADDVLGTLCRLAEEHEIEALVLTGDTDILQLVSPWVRVLLAYSVQKQKTYDEAGVRERYGGLGPEAVPDIKALEGDTSDNIPGVPGIGAKTATKLLLDHGSVEGILSSLDEVKPPRIRESLRQNEQVALRSKILATIVRDVPLEFDLEASRFWRYDRSGIVEALRDLEFFSMVPRIPEPHDGAGAAVQEELFSQEAEEAACHIVDTMGALEAMIEALETPAGFAFEVQTSSPDPMAAYLVGLAFANAPGEGWYVPVGHVEGRQLGLGEVLEAVKPLLENAAVPKVAHNANAGMTVLSRHGVEVTGLAFDTMLAAHLGGRKALDLKALAIEQLGVELTPASDLLGTGRKQITMAQAPIGDAASFAAANTEAAFRLHDILGEESERKGIRSALDEVELPLVPVLVRMQTNGTALDVGLLDRMSGELSERIAGVTGEIFATVGHEFNPGSSQQLGDVLFKELRLPTTKRTKTGFSTDASSLEALKELMDRGEADAVDPKAREVLDSVLEYRQLTKIKSTYVDALPALVNAATGRLHTRYNQTGSATGRVSSNDPNVQNIPVRTELGREVRKAFVAQGAPEWELFAADYSQIELRVLAHVSQDPGLLEAFRNGQDIHDATASSAFGVPLERVDVDMRRIAKIMNFGVIYGLSPFGISQQTGLSAEQGREFIDSYFGSYPGIKEYIDETKATVKKTGYVETLLGRRRYIPEIQSRSFHVRAAGERMAINMPIQGTAADIIKIAMVRLQARLDDLNMRTMMIIQVHDELIFEAPRDEMDQLESIVLELMPSAMQLAAPLDVETKKGRTWGDME